MKCKRDVFDESKCYRCHGIFRIGQDNECEADELCRCGHDQADHKQLYLDGCPTPHFPCHGYGCECGKFEQIDWDEADANREASMLYQRDIQQ